MFQPASAWRFMSARAISPGTVRCLATSAEWTHITLSLSPPLPLSPSLSLSLSLSLSISLSLYLSYYLCVYIYILHSLHCIYDPPLNDNGLVRAYENEPSSPGPVL